MHEWHCSELFACRVCGCGADWADWFCCPLYWPRHRELSAVLLEVCLHLCKLSSGATCSSDPKTSPCCPLLLPECTSMDFSPGADCSVQPWHVLGGTRGLVGHF